MEDLKGELDAIVKQAKATQEVKDHQIDTLFLKNDFTEFVTSQLADRIENLTRVNESKKKSKTIFTMLV